ncbi:DUF5680 domain-containing protein [Thermoplasma sp.]|uniref:DUF5680 domain-containing protein n=1 Tax=Thermoplasma sp. TaxID=1973142 RepID=UPI0012830B3B|nr:DUF5680 domain-containing protein [Thermoplasma sp.]KAA8921988.1 MAG: hypothetical protein F6Q11_06775 [Thermoplasma sp.]
MDEESITAFIVKAKKNTYATNGGKSVPRIPGSREHRFRYEEYEYTDIYFGELSFNGIETVFHKGKPIWGMVYSGAVLDEESSVEAIYAFLKKCLSMIDEEAPFRGPKSYEEDEYAYYNDFSGDIYHFIGYEHIDSDQGTLYELHYSGGEIG